jgi:hypothetical protein
MENFDFSSVRGFNYQPSYGGTSLENWLFFKPEIFELELRRGKQYFPKFSTVRLWLSWDAFVRNPLKFTDNFETALTICDRLDLRVIACLMNRWHNNHLDCGGVYLDHLIPDWHGWCYKDGFYKPYFDAIVGGHKNDCRILVWDTCNEPFTYTSNWEKMSDIPRIEFEWLEAMYAYIKELGAEQYVAFSPHPMSFEGKWYSRYTAINDVFLIHPYFVFNKDGDIENNKADFERRLDEYAAIGAREKKGMIATECCWGSLDNLERAKWGRYSLQELVKRGIGICPHALHHSLVADLHGLEYGPVAVNIGDLSFINPDGTLRSGHEFYNEF